MNRLFVLALGALLALAANAEEKQAIRLYSISGSMTTYFLDTQPVITMEKQRMLISGADYTMRVPLDQIDYWEVGVAEYEADDPQEPDEPDDPQNGLSQGMQAEKASLGVYGQEVTVANPGNAVIAVYDMNGKKMAEYQGSVVRFCLTPGIYVITVGTEKFKIATH